MAASGPPTHVVHGPVTPSASEMRPVTLFDRVHGKAPGAARANPVACAACQNASASREPLSGVATCSATRSPAGRAGSTPPSRTATQAATASPAASRGWLVHECVVAVAHAALPSTRAEFSPPNA